MNRWGIRDTNGGYLHYLFPVEPLLAAPHRGLYKLPIVSGDVPAQPDMIHSRIGRATSRSIIKDGCATTSFFQLRWHSGVIPPARPVDTGATEAHVPARTTKVLPPKAIVSDAPL